MTDTSAASSAAALPPLVSTDWLAANLGAPDLRVLDASYYLPAVGRDARAEFRAAHVPGAVHFDLDATSDPTDPLPHMLPDADQFARQMAALGLSDGDRIVVYDASGVNLSAPRVWWTFRAFGHPRVAVLDGGFAKWRREGRPVESGEPAAAVPGRFTARLDAARVRSAEQMRANLATGAEQVVDARAADRFAGTVAEPRAGLRSGHIPGSTNVPFTELVGPDGTVRPVEELRRRFAAAGLDLDRPIVASCGSGVTACAVALGLALAGHDGTAVYDGSWTEWGGRADLPVETGPSVHARGPA